MAQPQSQSYPYPLTRARARPRPLVNRRLTEPAVWRRQQAGSRNQYGEFVPGAAVDKAVAVATAPAGEFRQPQLSGQRLVADRTFWVDKSAARGAATADGTEQAAALTALRESDVIVWGGSEWVVNEVDDWGDFMELRTLRRGE